MEKFDYKLSNCCNPIPGDNVFGFITINDGIKIHRENCPNAIQMMSKYDYRIVKAKWTNQESIAFLAGLRISGIDQVGLVNELTKVISSEYNVNMRSISFDTDDGIFTGHGDGLCERHHAPYRIDAKAQKHKRCEYGKSYKRR